MTVEVMEESAGDVLGFKLSGRITDEDYKNVMTPRLEEALKGGDPVRLLVYIDETYRGLEPGATWDDAKFGLSHLGDIVRGRFKKVALVGGPNWQRRAGEIFGHLIPGEVKGFEAEEMDKAWTWVKQ
jgi:SpoIIAA-like